MVEQGFHKAEVVGPNPTPSTMHYVYILQSLVNQKYYIGTTANFMRRFAEHNSKLSKSTAPYVPYEIKLTERYPTIEAAYQRERFLKNKKIIKII